MPSELPRLTLRLSEEMINKIQRLAEEQKKSVNKLIKEILEKEIEKK